VDRRQRQVCRRDSDGAGRLRRGAVECLWRTWGALAVGATKWQTIATTVVPAAFRGLATGFLLGIARVAGETAPLLFTSFNNQFWNVSVTQPTASLPVMIFTYAISPYAEWHRQAWAAGFVLLALVFTISVIARGFLAPRQMTR